MTLKPLSAFILLAMPLAGLHAAALDRSGQSTLPFFQAGNYLELGYSDLQPKVGGTDTSGNDVPEMAKDYHFASAAAKYQLDPQYSLGLIYDQPFGAAAEYQGQNNFVAANNSYTLAAGVVVPNAAVGITGVTNVDVESHNMTFLLGYKPMPNVTVFGGAALQSLEGSVNLRGPAYGPLSGYSATIEQDHHWGYVLGAAFEKPEIALKAALTYRSEIDHKLITNESIALPTAAFAALQGTSYKGVPVQAVVADASKKLAAVSAALAQNPTNTALQGQQAQLQGALRLAGLAQLSGSGSSDTKITTPQSVNLDFQTGIMEGTLAFANVRWVDWSQFSIKPALFAKTTGLSVAGGLNLVDYTDDQWSATVGVGRKLNPQLSTSVSVGWDSGAGNPITTLGPTEGYWNVGLGARYSPVENVDVSLGVKYFWLGDATAKVSSGTVVGDFKDNTALALGLKLGYHF